MKNKKLMFILTLLLVLTVVNAIASTYSASGYVKYTNGMGVSGVTIYFSNGSPFVTTNSNGYWAQTGLNGNVTIIPSMKDYAFSPSSITLSSGASNVNFVAYYSVSGYVKSPESAGIPNVKVSFSNGASPVVTNSDGYWSQSGLSGTVVIVPTLRGYTFEASEISVAGPSINIDFTGSYAIGGQVTLPNGIGMKNVYISFSNGATPVMTNANGYWSKSGFSGTITVKPSLNGYTFKPSSISVDAPMNDLNFVSYYSVSGYVRDLKGNGISNIRILFSNGASPVVTNSDGYWSKDELSGIVYISPSSTGYDFNTSKISVNGPSTSVNFVASYSVSGYVRTPNGKSLPNVVISFNGASPVVTNSNGYWSQSGLSGTVIVIPTLAGYTFKKSSITLNVPEKNVNFTAYYNVSGYVKTPENFGVPNVIISFSGGIPSVITDSHGYWSQSGLSGTITVKPSLQGYTFKSSMVSVDGPNNNVDFNAFYVLSGYVKFQNGMGIANVKISFSNGASSVLTNTNGYWSKDGLSGNVIVIPSHNGYSFTPFSLYTNGPNDEANFIASYTLSGYIRDLGGIGIPGVTVSFSNGASSVVTNSQGYWSQSNLSGIVVITPNLNGYVFNPSSTSISMPNNNVNFKGAYSVSGYVTNPKGNGIPNIPISFSNGIATVTTNSNGYWSQSGLSGITMIKPHLKGYSFTPFGTAINGPTNNVNFTATYNVSGYVKTPDGVGVPNVQLSFNNNALTTTTDHQGYWMASDFSGTITIKPSLSGYMFNPSSISVKGPGNEINFAAYKLPPYSPSIYVPITITNSQPFQTPVGFQQEVIFNPQPYASYESWDLGNVRFYDSNGNPLYSWLESGGLFSATAVIWVKLDQAVPANGSLTIMMKFLKPGTEFDGNYAGEAPNLSQPYGKYDNGFNVFVNYQNFAGTNVPSGWYEGTINANSPTINNGVEFSLNWGGGNNWMAEQWLGSNWPTNPSQLYNEVYVISELTNNWGGGGNNGTTANAQIMLMVSSANPTTWQCQPNNSIGYQNGSSLEISSNWGGGPTPNTPVPQVVFQTNPNPQLPSIIGVYANKIYSNYIQIGNLNQNILYGGGYLTFDNNASSHPYGCCSGSVPTESTFAIYWVRQRIAPPNNVMPIVIPGAVMQ